MLGAIGRAVKSTAFNIGRAVRMGYSLSGRGNVGGLYAIGAGAAIGAAVGAKVASDYETTDPGTGAMIGGAVGAATLPAAGLAGRAAFETTRFALPYVGAGAAAVGKAAAVGSFWTARNVAAPLAEKYFNTFTNLAGRMFEYTPKREIFDSKAGKLMTESGLKIKPLGWAVLGGTALYGGIKGALETSDRIRMGTPAQEVTRATPRMPSYANNAGATGDLVFALNANRRG